MTPEKYMELLNGLLIARIPIGTWGTCGYKRISDLINEIDSGESEVILRDSLVILKTTRVLLLDVFYANPNDNVIYRLKEESQTLEGGRVRRRRNICSVSEKLFKNEPADEDAIRRAVREELGIEGKMEISFVNIYTTLGKSESYPGILSQSEKFRYRVFISKDDFKPEGYIETQTNVITRFVWEKWNPLSDSITDDKVILVNQ